MKKWTGISLAVAVAAAIIAGAGSASASGSAAANIAPAANNVAAVTPQVAVTPTLAPEQLYVPLAPCRIIDTRNAGGILHPNETRNFAVAGTDGFATQGGRSGGCGVPADAVAFTASVTATDTAGTGFLSAYPFNTTPPNGGTFLNYGAGLSVTTGISQAITPNSTKNWTVKNFAGRTDLVVDVTGYYVPQIEAQVGGDGKFTSGTSRILDVVHAGTGVYYVDLDRNARSCSVQATAYNQNRYASAGLSDPTTPNRVSVNVWVLNGTTQTPADYPFHVLVTC